MLKAKVENNPESWDEHLDYCMMAYRSSVHCSMGHTPFELMFGREMRIPLDVMMAGAKDSECSYTEFVAGLQENLEAAYQDVRQNLKVAQRRQKDAYDKGVKHTVYEAGDLVLRYTPQLKPGETSKFHRQWEGPFEIVARVTEVTYRVRKVGGHSRRSKVVLFNNLRLYQRRTEGVSEEVAAAQMDGSVAREQMEAAEGDCEPSSQDPEFYEDDEHQPWSADISLPSTVQKDTGSDPAVVVSDTLCDLLIDAEIRRSSRRRRRDSRRR